MSEISNIFILKDLSYIRVTKIKKLGYNPKVSIGEGIENFVNWYKSYYKVN